MLLNISLALAATGGYIMRSTLGNNNGRTGTMGTTPSTVSTLIMIAAIVAAFFVMTWWWVLIGIAGMALITGTVMAIFRENSMFVGMLSILSSVVMLIVYFAIR